MLKIKTHKQFEKDVKKSKKRGKNLSKIWNIVDLLIKGEKLPVKNRPHKLTGNWQPYYECHIEPDWLLVYLVTDQELILVRTGSHSDLFD